MGMWLLQDGLRTRSRWCNGGYAYGGRAIYIFHQVQMVISDGFQRHGVLHWSASVTAGSWEGSGRAHGMGKDGQRRPEGES